VNFSEFYLAKSERRMKKEENMCYIFGQPLKFGVYILSPASFVGQERAKIHTYLSSAVKLFVCETVQFIL